MASPSHLLFSLTAATLLTQSHAFWREACSVVQTGRIDPILAPDQVSGHVHKFAGGSNVNWYSDNTTLPTSTCSSCEVQDDKSAYWSPQLYYAHSNGSFEEVPNYGMTVYFLAPTPAGDTTPITAFPPGFKMISGNATLRSYNNNTLTYNNTQPIADRVSFHCIDSSDLNLAEEPYMFRTDCDQGMRAQILFQSCWDGVNTYLPGSAHVAYQTEIGNGGCPPDHPVILPLLFYEVLYWTIDIDQSAGGEFVFAQGDTTGYGFHGDFLNGWNQDVLESAVENCLSLADNPDGTVSTCSALAASDNVNFPRTCPEQPSFVAEPVTGLLDHLPGCNPVTSGPEPQPQVVCQVDSTIPVSSSSSAASAATSTTTIYFPGSTETSTGTVTVSTSSTTSSTGSSTTSSITSSITSSTTSSTTPTFTTPSFSFSGSFPPSASSSLSSSTNLSISFSPSNTFAANVPGPFFPNTTATSSFNMTATPTFSGPEITTFVTVTNSVMLNTTLTSITTVSTVQGGFFPNGRFRRDIKARDCQGGFFSNTTTPMPANTTATPTSGMNSSSAVSETTIVVTATDPFTISLPFANATAFPTKAPAAFFPLLNTTSTTFNATGTPPTNSTGPAMTTFVTVTEPAATTTTTVLELLVVPNATTFITATVTSS